jgi:hypothetical protein
LPAGKYAGILTYFQTTVNKKMTKKALFLVILPVRQRLIAHNSLEHHS